MSNTIIIFHIFYIMYISLSVILTENSSVGNPNIIKRADWGAVVPTSAPIPLNRLPADYVIITQTLSEPCKNRTTCIELIRKMQYFQMKQLNKNDIIDNFIVGGDGNMYEGRGWDVQPEEFRSFDRKSIFISFVGDYSKITPVNNQIAVTLDLLKFGVDKKKLNKKYKLLSFRQIAHNVNPGVHLYEIIKKWKHWVAVPY